jgi:hypothetical protein
MRRFPTSLIIFSTYIIHFRRICRFRHSSSLARVQRARMSSKCSWLCNITSSWRRWDAQRSGKIEVSPRTFARVWFDRNDCKSTIYIITVTITGQSVKRCNFPSSSSSALDLLRSAIHIPQENPSITEKVFPNFYFLLAGILRSFLESCQCILFSFFCTVL